jgi:hypothetical protein
MTVVPGPAAAASAAKRALRPADSRLKYVDHIEDSGIVLFDRVCELDLEVIVAKHTFAPYVSEREQSTWFKILNRGTRRKPAGKSSSNAIDTATLWRVGIRVSVRALPSKCQ